MEQAVQQFILAHRVARLATADADGEPSVIPICYVFDAGSIYSPVDEKPKSVGPNDLKRLRNIRENNRVSVVIDDYSEDWSQLAYLVIRGLAEIIEPAEPDRDEHTKGVTMLRTKYPQYRSMSIEARPMIKIKPMLWKMWRPAATLHG
ncbi:MAG TPA: TIGR03668 family PPOX class F420-dependent oxidoreductase, partial [Blastocatellia bacterium]|nr:TIGR03668 family PPOX class F420-dependent oxidoreductase [Blastocatellia bacterium]